MTTYTVECCLYAATTGRVDFPEGKTWDDVQDWYVKWDSLYVQFKGGTEYEEFSLNSNGLDAIDWKRPQSTTVFAFDPETEATDYDKEIASANT